MKKSNGGEKKWMLEVAVAAENQADSVTAAANRFFRRQGISWVI